MYEINSDTLAVIYLDNNKVKIIEKFNEFELDCSSFVVIDRSCKFFGSSYNGRKKGTKSLIGVTHKAPIIIEETKETIFFPTTSPRLEECSWISLKNIKDYKRNDKNSIIIFNNGYELHLNISYGSLENQIFRATRLGTVLRDRKIG